MLPTREKEECADRDPERAHSPEYASGPAGRGRWAEPSVAGVTGVTLCTITSPEPTSTFVSVRTWTLPRSTRPAAGAAFAVTEPGTVHDAPAGRSALASVTVTEPNAGFANTST